MEKQNSLLGTVTAAISGAADLYFAGLLAIVFALPGFTASASAAALCRCWLRYEALSEEAPAKVFIRVFRTEMRPCLKLSLVLLLLNTSVLAGYLWILPLLSGSAFGLLYTAVWSVLCLIAACVGTYSPVVSASLETGVEGNLRLSLYLAVSMPLRTAALLGALYLGLRISGACPLLVPFVLCAYTALTVGLCKRKLHDTALRLLDGGKPDEVKNNVQE